MAVISKSSTPKDDDLISIVGHPDKYPYGKVKDSVIHLTGEFFFKDDSVNVVRIKVDSTKTRLYRKKSKLVIKLSNGQYALKKNCIENEGLVLDITSPDTVKLPNGKYTRKDYTTTIDGELFLITDPRLGRCHLSGEFIKRDNAIKLATTYYADKFVSPKYLENLKKDSSLPKHNNYILANESRLHLDPPSGEPVLVHMRSPVFSQSCVNVFHKFRDATNPQLDRIDYLVMTTEGARDYCVRFETPNMHFLVHKNKFDEVTKIYKEIILVSMAKTAKALRAALKYSDDGPDENISETIHKVGHNWPGKSQVYPRPRTPDFKPSRSFKLTGGIKYTFGVELETAQGLVPQPVTDGLYLNVVGDRSISAAEYVTGVLHGDEGIVYLEQVCKALSEHTFVDDKCGLHVHVGSRETPFDKHFAINAIKLGCLIEPDLYLSCPENRAPTMKHCHSIMRYKNINSKTWKEHLGSFVFGPIENWGDPFSMMNYKYGTGDMNKERKLDNWCGGRYKWLNLVHILSRGYDTCELRLFPGTTSFEKVYNYVLMSMAFCWYVENKSGNIDRGNVTIADVLTAPFKSNNEVGEKLLAFYEARVKRFKRNRDTLYPAVIPAAF